MTAHRIPHLFSRSRMTALASMLLGTALGAANAAASIALYRVARSRPPQVFMAIVLGGMLLRMMVLLTALTLILAFVPVARGALVGAFGVTFVLGLIGEVAFVLSRPAPPSAGRPIPSVPSP